jgi:L-ribulokinase
MQTYADVCNRPMKVSRSSQTCALGAAIFGAVVGGAFRTTEEAQRRMTGAAETTYAPSKAAAAAYADLYRLYRCLHDSFGTRDFDGKLFGVMKDLIAIRDRVRSGR